MKILVIILIKLYLKNKKMNELKKIISLDNPLRLLYHKIRAVMANIIYWFPSKWMTIIWVTWTNWKTTTCNLIAKWLIQNWEKVFMFSTVNIIIGTEETTNYYKMTSPDVFVLQKLIKKAKNKWIKTIIIETASHWIKMNRIWWLDYDILVLTNISQDHLDLHRTMEDYVNTKLTIFKNLIKYKRKDKIKKTAIINLESEYSDLFIWETYDSLYTYGQTMNCNLFISNYKESFDNNEFDIKIWWQNINIKTKMIWKFNVYNIWAAVWVLVSLWIKLKKIPSIIENINAVPWRLENIDNNNWYKIFVDYAHTPDALENILTSLNRIKTNKLICVFWATWDRDKTKRPIMWEVVSRLADKIILTQDDDYSENTLEIIKDVMSWIWRKEWDNFWIIKDREEAIRTALLIWEKWDIIVIAWKWDEHVLVTNKWAIEWNDKKKINDILEEFKEE